MKTDLSPRVDFNYCGPSTGVGVGVGVEDGVGVGVKIGWATVGIMQGPVLAPPVLVAPSGKGALPGEIAAEVPIGVGATLGLVATVGVTVEPQG
jgi:hypothetical protein